MAADPQDTKEKLLDAAERLFAEHGYEGSSMRRIAAAAQVNLAAAHYHFGSKRGLFQAVFQRRIGEIQRERFERLDALEARHAGPVPLEEVLTAFLAPAVFHLGRDEEGWRCFTRLMGRLFAEGGEEVSALHEVVRPTQERFLAALARVAPHLGQAELHWRLHLLVGTLCSLLANPERFTLASRGICDANEREIALRELVAFAAGAFSGPGSARPSALRSGRRKAKP